MFCATGWKSGISRRQGTRTVSYTHLDVYKRQLLSEHQHQAVAGVAAGSLTVRGCGRVVAAGAGSDAGLHFYGVCLLDEGFGADVASETLVVDASWLDATGTDAGVACGRGSLVAAHFVTPAGGAFGAARVVDADGTVATHVVIEPDGATAPAGETVTPLSLIHI